VVGKLFPFFLAGLHHKDRLLNSVLHNIKAVRTRKPGFVEHSNQRILASEDLLLQIFARDLLEAICTLKLCKENHFKKSFDGLPHH